jgi:hypothetical protein
VQLIEVPFAPGTFIAAVPKLLVDSTKPVSPSDFGNSLSLDSVEGIGGLAGRCNPYQRRFESVLRVKSSRSSDVISEIICLMERCNSVIPTSPPPSRRASEATATFRIEGSGICRVKINIAERS